MISPPSNTNIWIAAGITDMRRGFTGLSAAAQTVLEQLRRRRYFRGPSPPG
jgi:transposase